MRWAVAAGGNGRKAGVVPVGGGASTEGTGGAPGANQGEWTSGQAAPRG